MRSIELDTIFQNAVEATLKYDDNPGKHYTREQILGMWNDVLDSIELVTDQSNVWKASMRESISNVIHEVKIAPHDNNKWLN